MNNDSYPVGADTPEAPWNEKENPEREIEVTVSLTLSKTVKVRVSDYNITDSGKDDDGNHFEVLDYSSCDLKGAVKTQVILPSNAYRYVGWPLFKSSKRAYLDLKDWQIDDFEVIQE